MSGTCAYCGKNVAADYAFCPHCGRPRKPTEQQSEQSDISPRAAAALDAFDKQLAALKKKRETAPPPRNGLSTAGWYYVIALILMLAILGGLFLKYQSIYQQVMKTQ